MSPHQIVELNHIWDWIAAAANLLRFVLKLSGIDGPLTDIVNLIAVTTCIAEIVLGPVTDLLEYDFGADKEAFIHMGN